MIEQPTDFRRVVFFDGLAKIADDICYFFA
jgi:hypothetical protein